MEMKQMLLAVGVAAVLAGCGKDAGGYEGYWREKSDKKEGVIAVKKKVNYFLNKINVFTGKEESLLLSEKDGALSINTGIGEIPIKLSDDGKELYVERRRYENRCGDEGQNHRPPEKVRTNGTGIPRRAKCVAVKPNVSAASGGDRAIETAV